MMLGYTSGMKTAISIPDALFEEADELARRLGTSRSELYCRAVREYLARHGSDRVTEALNEVYATEQPDTRFVERAAQLTLERSEW